MAIRFEEPKYKIVRDFDKCINCRICERQCVNKAHEFIESTGRRLADRAKMTCKNAVCVNCKRCVSLCLTGALSIQKAEFEMQREYSFYESLRLKLPNPEFKNPSLPTPEIKVFLGAKPSVVKYDKFGKPVNNLPEQTELSMPVMFSPVDKDRYNDNVRECLKRAAAQVGIIYHRDDCNDSDMIDNDDIKITKIAASQNAGEKAVQAISDGKGVLLADSLFVREIDEYLLNKGVRDMVSLVACGGDKEPTEPDNSGVSGDAGSNSRLPDNTVLGEKTAPFINMISGGTYYMKTKMINEGIEIISEQYMKNGMIAISTLMEAEGISSRMIIYLPLRLTRRYYPKN